MTVSEAIGFALWVMLFYPVWSPRLRRRRRQARLAEAAVSRNREPYDRTRLNERRAELREQERQTGPAWEQDAPMDECFEEEAMNECPTCGDSMPEGVECHHHNTEDHDYGGETIVSCQDCPYWYPLHPKAGVR